MTGQMYLFFALTLGIVAGLIFYLIGRAWLASPPPAEEPEEKLRPRPQPVEGDLSPEVQAFIKALETPDTPKTSERLRLVEVWDARQNPWQAQG
jgi:hypothetical protein